MESTLQRYTWLTPAILFIMVWLLLGQGVIPPQAGYGFDSGDLSVQFYPMYRYTLELVRQGELPLWNPHQFAGFPVVGNPQAGIFYPATWLAFGFALLGLPIAQALALVILLHVWWAAWGMAVFARRYDLTLTGAFVAGVVYGMSGWMGARLYGGHYTMLIVFAWLPWFLAGWHQTLHAKTLRAVIPAAVTLGMAGLGGHPQTVLHIVLAGFVLWSVYHHQAGWRGWWQSLLRLTAIGMLAGLFSAVILLPTAELTRLSDRTQTGLAFANTFAMPPAQLLTLGLPFLFGTPKPDDLQTFYWGVDFYQETHATVGLLPIIALMLALRLNDRRMTYPLTLAVLGVVLSLGTNGVLFAVLVRWIPGFALFRAPGRFLLLFVIAAALVVGLLLTHLQTRPHDRRKAILAPALKAVPYGVAVLLSAAILFAGWFASASHVEPMPVRAMWTANALMSSGLVLLAIWGVLWGLAGEKHTQTALILAVLLVTFDVWRATMPIAVTGDVSTQPLWQGAAAVFPTETSDRLRAYTDPNDFIPNAPNHASAYGFNNIEGYDPLELNAYSQLMRAVGDAHNNPNNPVYRLLGVNIVASHTPREDDGWALMGILNDFFYYQREDAVPRAWVATDAILQPDDAIARQLIVSGEVNPHETVILHEPFDCELAAGTTNVDITNYRANQVTVQTNGDGGVLVLSDQFYAGWQATLDGQPTEIRRAYTVLRAVCVPAGAHEVVFHYRPRSVQIGGIISIMTLLGLLGGWYRIRQ
jgi:hypothetical protein